MKLLSLAPLLAALAHLRLGSFAGLRTFALCWAGGCFLTLVIAFVFHLRPLGFAAILASLVPLVVSIVAVVLKAAIP